MADGHAQAEHAHPGAKTYVAVAGILAVITAVEVAVFYIEALRPVIVPILLVLSATKFALVVGFDSKLFTAVFVGPLVVAIGLILAMLALYGVFTQSGAG